MSSFCTPFSKIKTISPNSKKVCFHFSFLLIEVEFYKFRPSAALPSFQFETEKLFFSKHFDNATVKYHEVYFAPSSLSLSLPLSPSSYLSLSLPPSLSLYLSLYLSLSLSLSLCLYRERERVRQRVR